MSGPVQEYTLNYQFEIPAFDFPNWNNYYARTLRTIDALFFLSTGITNVKGPWKNATLYNVGDIAVDMVTPSIWQCLVQHTSAAAGAFSADRTLHPTFWQATLALPKFRGNWAGPGTLYFQNDFVVSGTQYAIAKTNHTSGATFAGDAANWTVLVDLGPNTPAINANAEDTIASAATTNLGSKVASFLNVTGVVTIGSFGTSANTTKVLRFSSALTLTNSGTLVSPTGADLAITAGDFVIVTSDSAGTTWRIIHHLRVGSAAAYVGRANTWAKPQTPVAAALTSGVGADFTANQVWTAAVSATFVISNPSVAPPDKTYISILVSFASTQSLAFGTKFKTSGYIASQGGNKDHLVFVYDLSSDQYWLVGVRNQVNL